MKSPAVVAASFGFGLAAMIGVAPVADAASVPASPPPAEAIASTMASSSDSSDSNAGLWGLGVALVAAGPVFYLVKMRRYSGAGLRNDFSKTTESQMSDVRGDDHFVKRVKGAPSVTL